MRDLDFTELDPGIRETVRWLRGHGFVTTDSGDGRSKAGTDREGCMQPIANVAIAVQAEKLTAEAERLMALVRERGIKAWPRNEDIAEFVDVTGLSSGDGVHIEAVFQPPPDRESRPVAMICVTGLDDALLERTRSSAAERRTFNPRAEGSIPSESTTANPSPPLAPYPSTGAEVCTGPAVGGRSDWSTVLSVAWDHLTDDGDVRLRSAPTALALGYMAAQADDWLINEHELGDPEADAGVMLDSIVGQVMMALPISLGGLTDPIRAALSAGVAAAWREMQAQAIREEAGG